ncbi:hypothetical protein BGX34_000827 [Mortierella sp. NVP85]|nr:hypothetical protein BGX34_000827 [Mortierella sp. NVP85]
MDLPEIRAAVARFLGDSDLAAAALVCKSWNANFAPALRAKQPSQEGIAAHAKSIRKLYLSSSTRMLGIESWCLNKQLEFPALKDLNLNVESDFPLEPQLDIIRKSPGLRSLQWNTRGCDPYLSSDICNSFKYCPLVEHLALNGMLLKDEDLSQILDSCRQIKLLILVPSEFREQAFRSLVRHFAHLRVLYLGICVGLSSKMAQQILKSCPNLSIFRGVTLKAQDILGIAEDNATADETILHQQPQDWVCTNLHTLSIFIHGLEGKPRLWHKRIFQQLAKMKKLVSLTIGPGISREASYDGLDLKLESGLDALAGLKHLSSLEFNGISQHMEERDVRWMIEAMPNLTELSGILHHDAEQCSKLERILGASGRQIL